MTEQTIPAVAVLEEAANLVGGARAKSHGDKLVNHQKIADVWNGILEASGKRTTSPLDAHDVANLMEGLKIARRYAGDLNRDDYVDGAGYAGVAYECRARAEANAQSYADAVNVRIAELEDRIMGRTRGKVPGALPQDDVDGEGSDAD